MPMMSPSINTMSTRPENRDLLDRLHAMLRKIKVTDEQILDGVRLTSRGMEKVAARLGISRDEADMLFNSLITKLNKDREHIDEMLREFEGPRFSYEKDYIGNVTIRDAISGKELSLRGSKAQRLLAALQDASDEQAFLGRYAGLMENEVDHAAALRDTGFWGKQGAGCIIMARKTGRILIAHRSAAVEEPNTWGSWGGAIDDGENPVDAVEREVGEETGYRGKIEKIVPLYVFRKDSFRYSNFLVVVDDEFYPRLNWESQGYEWCAFGDWPSPLHFGLKALFSDAESLNIIKAEASESISESVQLDEDDSFDDEIRSTSGSFNFPWKVGGEHGFATARFNGRGDDLTIKVINVRNHEGDVIKSNHLAEIEKQGYDFIGEE